MIVFDLKCGEGHRFEAWFRSSDDFETQCRDQVICCPVCSDAHIEKAPMAPAINSGERSESEPAAPAEAGHDSATGADIQGDEVGPIAAAELPPALRRELDNVLSRVREHVEKTCDYVGRDFANEARRMHYGEADSRDIYGEATNDETVELLEEGIDVMPLPLRRKTDA